MSSGNASRDDCPDLDEVVKAKKALVDASLVLWKFRLKTIAETEGSSAALDVLRQPVEPTEDVNIPQCNSKVCNTFTCNTMVGCGKLTAPS